MKLTKEQIEDLRRQGTIYRMVIVQLERELALAKASWCHEAGKRSAAETELIGFVACFAVTARSSDSASS
jgi:hypothetical protein